MTASYNNPFLKNAHWQILNGETIEASQNLEADVVIIGSGAGGGISAEILSKQGLKVIVVEEGALRTSLHFEMHEKKAYPELYQENAARKTLNKGINILQGRTVGGSTTVNWTSSFRTPDEVLKHWRSEYQAKGLSTNEMKPWFEWAEKRLNVHQWQLAPNENNHLLKLGAESLGWHASVISRNVKACLNLGYCGMGCPVNAKQSMLVTTIPTALEQGATLITRARAHQLVHDNHQVSGVVLHLMDQLGHQRAGIELKVHARHVILSAGAIGSPAILLRSKVPDPYGLIGSRTFLHPVTGSAALFEQEVAGFSGAPQSIYSDEHLWPKDASLGFKLEVPPLHPLLISTVVNGFGAEHFKVMKQFSHLQATLALHRDGFHPESAGGQVVLDEYGYPHLDYVMSNYMWQGMKKSYFAMAELQFAAGAKTVQAMHADSEMMANWKQAKKELQQLSMQNIKVKLFSAHVMGGCRLGDDPKNAVVNSQLEHHQLQGLSIIDGSVFPTSVGVNPQLSIYGLSAKSATALAERIK